jgi:arylsulfatase
MKQATILLAWIFAALTGWAQHTGSRPNVIVILSDDQGYADYSCNGNPALQTPALDRLCRENISFSNFHVSPYCTPTRGQLMSGLDALHNKAATVGTGRNTMRRDIVTMPEVFRENGYRTGIFGKWHLGDNYPDRPMDRGFEKCVWFKGWGLLSESEYDNDYYKTRYLDSITPVLSDKYCTDLWFDKAISWMDSMATSHQPFFAYIPTNAPHGPFYAPEADYQYYRDKVPDSSTAQFFGMLRDIDRNVARLQQWLEEKKLMDNTIVIYMNDNGGTGGVDFYNAGMRGKKGENYDGGHRAACFMHWPGAHFGAPRTIGYAAEVQDLLPTFIDLLHLKTKGSPHFDGRSLGPVLKGQQGKDRMFVVQYGGGVRPEQYFSCVVWNSWRLVGKDELYDISRDSGQQHNVSSAFPEVLKKMRSFYDSWWENLEAGIDQFVPIVVGAPQENPVVLTSDFWANGDYINTQWKVAQVAGKAKGGVWHVNVERSGKYLVELGRWPFHLHRRLDIAGPGKGVGGTRIRKGKAVPIRSARFSVNGREPLILTNSDADFSNLFMELQLEKGSNTFQGWFCDQDGKAVCAAYYLRLTRKE